MKSSDFNEWKRSYVEMLKADISVCLPAKVLSYDVSKGSASIEVQLKKIDTSGKSFSMSPFQNIPVLINRTGSFFIHNPIGAGTLGILIVCDKDMDLYKSLGGLRQPINFRKHDINDAIFIAGLYPFNRALSGINNTDLIIGTESNNMRIHITPAGLLEIKKGGVTKLILNNDGNFVITNGDLIADGISFKTHVHSGVESGDEVSGPPLI